MSYVRGCRPTWSPATMACGSRWRDSRAQKSPILLNFLHIFHNISYANRIVKWSPITGPSTGATARPGKFTNPASTVACPRKRIFGYPAAGLGAAARNLERGLGRSAILRASGALGGRYPACPARRERNRGDHAANDPRLEVS